MRELNATRKHALEAITVEPLSATEALPSTRKPIKMRLRNWRVVIGDDGVAWALLDKRDVSANTLSESVIRELDRILGELEKTGPKGLVIRSAKPGGFIAGAEIGDFRGFRNETKIANRLREALAVLDRLERFPAPTIALIHGFCLGGGLELALACKHRIARSDARLGFPEVMLGLHPGLAGTWRILRQCDPVQAMTLMLTGRTLRARAAKRAGLVDAVTEERHFEAAVRFAIDGKLRAAKRPWTAALLRLTPARRLTAWQMRRQTAAKVNPEHYPAPFALIKLWRDHGGSNSAMRKMETPSFARLLAGDTAQNLVRVFFLRERLKAYAKGAKSGVSRVHVVGAGTMGGDIAAWCAAQGMTVTLQDRAPEFIAPAMKRAAKLFKRKLKTEGEIRSAFDRLIPDLAGDGIANADLIIEVVPEDLKIKKAVYRDVEARMRDDAILATNTSSISLEQLAKGLKKPERFVGMHFFNPVARMPLVEVVTHGRLSGEVRDRAFAFADAIDRLPLPVRSAPGFLVNRALTPYLLEALTCYAEGTRPETIDAAAENFGMPMGPIELADQVGLDVCLHVAKVLKRDLKTPSADIPDWLERKVADGHLGRKTGKGFYEYRNGRPVKRKVQGEPSPALQDRLILPLVNACAAALREGIVEDADVVDAGMIFGTGFAPFRGGPLHYAATRGRDDVVTTLEGLAAIHGPRLAPDKGFSKLGGDK